MPMRRLMPATPSTERRRRHSAPPLRCHHGSERRATPVFLHRAMLCAGAAAAAQRTVNSLIASRAFAAAPPEILYADTPSFIDVTQRRVVSSRRLVTFHACHLLTPAATHH